MDLPDPGIEPGSPALQAESLPTELSGKPKIERGAVCLIFLNSSIVFYRWRRDRLPTPVFLGFPCGSAGKESTSNTGDLGLIPGLGRSPGEGKGYTFQYSVLENSMDCIVYGVTESDMTEQLSLSL